MTRNTTDVIGGLRTQLDYDSGVIEKFCGEGWEAGDFLQAALHLMAQKGSSVLLNYGEDDRQWECSWITSGKRFSGFSDTLLHAVAVCVAKVRDAEDRSAQREFPKPYQPITPPVQENREESR